MQTSSQSCSNQQQRNGSANNAKSLFSKCFGRPRMSKDNNAPGCQSPKRNSGSVPGSPKPLGCGFGVLCEKLCCRGRYVPPDKSSVFFIQALLVWMMLSLPGNIVTFVMYHRVYNSLHENQLNGSELLDMMVRLY